MALTFDNIYQVFLKLQILGFRPPSPQRSNLATLAYPIIKHNIDSQAYIVKQIRSLSRDLLDYVRLIINITLDYGIAQVARLERCVPLVQRYLKMINGELEIYLIQ